MLGGKPQTRLKQLPVVATDPLQLLIVLTEAVSATNEQLFWLNVRVL